MDARLGYPSEEVPSTKPVGIASRAALAALVGWAVAAAGSPAARALESTYPVRSDPAAWLVVAALSIALFAATTADFALWLAPGGVSSRGWGGPRRHSQHGGNATPSDNT